MSKEKQKKVKWQVSYGEIGTRVSLSKLPVTENIFNHYNDAIIKRFNDIEARKMEIPISKKEVEMIILDFKSITPIKSHLSLQRIILWGEGIPIAIFSSHTKEELTKPDLKIPMGS